MGLGGREERRLGQGRAPLPPSPNRTRRGGRRPPSFLPSTSSLLPLLVQQGKGGGPAPGRRRTPPGAPHLLGRQPSPCSFIYGGKGAPLDTQLIYDILAVCGAPSTILHLDNIVVVLRRSPASVEHHHRHHAVVLTKLSLNTRLDRSSRDVIELNVC